jgi:hypothetical protein
VSDLVGFVLADVNTTKEIETEREELKQDGTKQKRPHPAGKTSCASEELEK